MPARSRPIFAIPVAVATILQRQQYCSAFLLSRTYPLSAINLEKSAEQSVAAIRMQWLDFCDRSGIPVPESNPVMITLSSAVYQQLLEHVERFQRSLTSNCSNGESVSTSPCSPVVTDGDDVHLRFGGATICEMLHLRYKQIKGCTDTQRNKLSQEITILQAMIMKDKTNLPHYLKYRDRGFMYFPDFTFVPFIRTVHETVSSVCSINSLGENTIEVCNVYRFHTTFTVQLYVYILDSCVLYYYVHFCLDCTFRSEEES